MVERVGRERENIPGMDGRGRLGKSRSEQQNGGSAAWWEVGWENETKLVDGGSRQQMADSRAEWGLSGGTNHVSIR